MKAIQPLRSKPMHGERLVQFQCGKEGTLFYYQTSLINMPSFIDKCPLCGSRRVSLTGRNFPALEENADIALEVKV